MGFRGRYELEDDQTNIVIVDCGCDNWNMSRLRLQSNPCNEVGTTITPGSRNDTKIEQLRGDLSKKVVGCHGGMFWMLFERRQGRNCLRWIVNTGLQSFIRSEECRIQKKSAINHPY